MTAGFPAEAISPNLRASLAPLRSAPSSLPRPLLPLHSTLGLRLLRPSSTARIVS